MNRKLHQLFQPSLQLYFVCLVVFALASALFSLPLAVLELMVVALLGLYHRANLRKRRREVTKYIENITGTVDVAAKDTMVNSPLPMVIFRPESGDIIWTNDRFLKLTDDGAVRRAGPLSGQPAGGGGAAAGQLRGSDEKPHGKPALHHLFRDQCPPGRLGGWDRRDAPPDGAGPVPLLLRGAVPLPVRGSEI